MNIMNEKIEKIKVSLDNYFKGTELTAEQLEQVTSIKKDLDEVNADFETQSKKYKTLQEMYLENYKSLGNQDKPQDEKKPRSLEEIALEVINKDNK